MEETIHHDAEAGRFTLACGDSRAHLVYEMRDAKTMDLTSTWTPLEERGKGIAGRLVRAALEYARTTGSKVIATCSYAAVWIERHPEYEELLA